jgi:hypothetical protein
LGGGSQPIATRLYSVAFGGGFLRLSDFLRGERQIAMILLASSQVGDKSRDWNTSGISECRTSTCPTLIGITSINSWPQSASALGGNVTLEQVSAYRQRMFHPAGGPLRKHGRQFLIGPKRWSPRTRSMGRHDKRPATSCRFRPRLRGERRHALPLCRPGAPKQRRRSRRIRS